MKKTAVEMDSLISEWLEEHRQRRDSDGKEREEDFIDVLLSAVDGVDLAGYDADTVIKATCLVSFLKTTVFIEINIHSIFVLHKKKMK